MSKTKKYMFIILFVLAAVLFAINGFSYARYASNYVWNYYLKSKGFYFNSDDLSLNTISHVNNMWDGGKTSFSINNSLNQSVVTEYDINYKVTCTIEGDNTNNVCYIGDTESNVYEGILSKYQACTNNTLDGVDTSSYNQSDCNLNGYNWINQVATKDLYFNVVNLNNEEINDVTINIKAESISPYKKTLSGKFKLHKVVSNEGNINMNYEDYSNYGRLVLSNSYSYDKCVQISWNSRDLQIDTDAKKLHSYATDSDGYINKIELNLKQKESVNYIFYKKNESFTYGEKTFSIEETDNCD